MKLKFYPALFFLFHSGIILCQGDYIITDTATHFGIRLLDGGNIINHLEIRQWYRDTVTLFKPFDIKEYGFKDKRVYVSKSILTDSGQTPVFLKQLTTGKINLYSYETSERKSYFLEKENLVLFELPIGTGSQKISKLTGKLNEYTSDCNGFAEMAENAGYREKPFIKLIKRYNECNIKPFPHFRFGIHAGYALSRLTPVKPFPDESDFVFDLKYQGEWLLGGFLDIPIDVSQFSLHASANYRELHFSNSGKTGMDEFDLVVNVSSLQLPLHIRYTLPFSDMIPYIEAGGVITKNFKTENLIYYAIVNDNIVEIQEILHPEWIASLQAGYTFGIGFGYELNSKHSVFFEANYMKLYNLKGQTGPSISDLQFTIGYNL